MCSVSYAIGVRVLDVLGETLEPIVLTVAANAHWTYACECACAGSLPVSERVRAHCQQESTLPMSSWPIRSCSSALAIPEAT